MQLPKFLGITMSLILVVGYNFVSGQTTQGRVLNMVTDFPIADVGIYNTDKKRSTLSDLDGYFNLELFSDTDFIHFQHPAFKNIVMTKAEIVAEDLIIRLEPDIVLMQEFSVTVSNIRENAEEIPLQIDILQAEDISGGSQQTSADILTNTGNIAVQKSQGGGGSPIIRGFEANKILLVLDGIRLNNAIYRSGHLQNAITIDNGMLESVELIYGPSSVIYGSDALGGVVHYHSLKPKKGTLSRKTIKGNASLQYQTANNSKVGHVDLNYGMRKFVSVSSFTYSDYGDLRVGNPDGSHISLATEETNYGILEHYAGFTPEGRDTMLTNPEPRVQKNTGYKQYDMLQKFLYAPNRNLDITANLQYSTSSNIDRFDALNDYSGDALKFASYYYGPQNRFLSAISVLARNENRYYTNVKVNLAYQNISEDRINRRFGNSEELHQEETVHVYSLNVDFLKVIREVDKLHYGLEATYNQVYSDAYYQDFYTGELSAAQTRYPDGDSYTQSYALYANYQWLIAPQYTLTAGFRYSYAYLKSYFLDDTFMQFPFNEINISEGSPTGSLSFRYYPTPRISVNAIASSGYRAPNVDDYGKVRAKSGLITMPSDKLKSEYLYNAELLLGYELNDYLNFSVSAYHSWLRDAIVRSDYSINGVDSILYDGDYYTMITNSNADNAVLYGVGSNLKINIPLNDFFYSIVGTIKFKATYNYTYGENVSAGAPLGHIPPPFGRALLGYERNKFTIEINTDYFSQKRIEDMSPYGEDNGDEGTLEGFPAWQTWNLKTRYTFNDHFKLYVNLENVFDLHYKPFASGLAAPGRNLSITLRAGF